MEDQPNREYDMEKINNYLYKLNKYQHMLMGTDDKDKKEKYAKKVKQYVTLLEKNGVVVKKSDDPKGKVNEKR
jgi:N-dimethylarginine dimethylaminohydrolase